MCGIATLFEFETQSSASDLERAVSRMTDTMVHRGPDGSGIWVDADTGIALGHRRLAIVDLSPTGHQPMTSVCDRFVISYNGEIYNAIELRDDLEAKGARFRGHSDTEVLLEGCAHWGVRATAEKLIGMFAFCLWDRRDRTLWLVRDRVGIKPLYWTMPSKNKLIAASELRALRAHPDCPKGLDPNAIATFLQHNYIPDELCIYQGVNKLLPGHILRIGDRHREPQLESYWTMEAVVSNGRSTPFDGTDEEALDVLESMLSDAVERRMISHVPLGAFLSGGIDSSIVVALMQANSTRPIRTFSIGFEEEGYNEATHAMEVATHLHTDHTELYVSPSEAQAVIPKLPSLYDEPFSDSSQIPTYLVSAMTRDHVTVALSGDGGDELFAGYNRYFDARKFDKLKSLLPGPMGAVASHCLRAVPASVWDTLFGKRTSLGSPSTMGDRIGKLANVLHMDRDQFYEHIMSHWVEADEIVPKGNAASTVFQSSELKTRIPNFTQRMQFIDSVTYLPGDILTKVDRASMGVSLEARVPLLDHRVVEFAWRLPNRLKIRNGDGKWLLRQLLYKHVPSHLVDRPKMGFGVPIDAWLRGPLKEWAEDMLSPDRLKRTGLVRSQPVQEKWHEHIAGKQNWHYLLWDILMLECWHEEWCS